MIASRWTHRISRASASNSTEAFTRRPSNPGRPPWKSIGLKLRNKWIQFDLNSKFVCNLVFLYVAFTALLINSNLEVLLAIQLMQSMFSCSSHVSHVSQRPAKTRIYPSANQPGCEQEEKERIRQLTNVS